MLSKFRGEKIFCGLDLGSRKLKAAVLKLDATGKLELLGSVEHDLRGFHDKAVTDLGELTQSIQLTLQDLSKKSQIKIKQVYLGVGGELVQARFSTAVIPLIDKGEKVIGTHDVKKVDHQAHLLGLKMEEEVLHELPQCYSVDDVNSILNPLGLFGRNLGVSSMMIVTNMNQVRNLTKAVNQIGYDVASVYFSSYTAAGVALGEEERTLGVTLIDIGSRVTSILIFKDKILKFFKKINLGGDDFTRAIASKLNLTFDLAEDIKKSYAAAGHPDQQKDEEVLVKKESEYLTIKSKVICQSIEGETLKLNEEILKALKGLQIYEEINRGIVLIGGGALLPGLIEQIATTTNRSAHLGKVHSISHKSHLNAALFAGVVGLACHGYQRTYAPHFHNVQLPWPKRILQHVGDLYQEYF